jgi:hypothetical protein
VKKEDDLPLWCLASSEGGLEACGAPSRGRRLRSRSGPISSRFARTKPCPSRELQFPRTRPGPRNNGLQQPIFVVVDQEWAGDGGFTFILHRRKICFI